MSGENLFCIFALVLGGLLFFVGALLSGPGKPKSEGYYLPPGGDWAGLGGRDVIPEFSEDDVNELEILEDEIHKRDTERGQRMWENIQLENERKKAREQELAAIANDFPQWLVKFGDDFGIVTYKGLVNLSKYIEAILAYAQDNFNGTMPIKRSYQVLRNGRGLSSPPPSTGCQGRIFFEDLSKTLSKNGLLIDGRGQKGKIIAQDAFIKLRPASSVQRPNNQDVGKPGGMISKPAKVDKLVSLQR